jgi:ADP-ribosylglycohydrolase
VFTGPLRPKFFVSVLQTAEKLAIGYDARSVATGNMASSSSAMCIAPVGIVNAGNPRAAASQAWSLGSLIHQGPVSFCADAAAAVAAAVAIAVVPGASLDEVLGAARTNLHPRYGAVMRELIEQALALAGRSKDYESFRRAFHRSFRQPVACDSRETVPAVFGLLALGEGYPKRCVEFAANFGRDTDTIGAMVGSISGAMAGARALPATWSTSLDPTRLNSERRTSAKLAALAIGKAADQRDVATAALGHLTT